MPGSEFFACLAQRLLINISLDDCHERSSLAGVRSEVHVLTSALQVEFYVPRAKTYTACIANDGVLAFLEFAIACATSFCLDLASIPERQ